MKECKECRCGEDYLNDLSRLEVLTGLVELAEKQLKKGSVRTMGWADLEKWRNDIIDLRTRLPKCAVEDLDNERKRQQHRPTCKCALCEEGRNYA